MSDVVAAIEAGACSVNEVKMLTRAGMGECQGRVCLRLVQRLLARRLSTPTPLPAARWPARPISLGDLSRPIPEPAVDQLALLELELEHFEE